MDVRIHSHNFLGSILVVLLLTEMTDCAVKRNATYSMYEEVNTKICGKDPQGLGGHMGIDNSASHCKFILRIGRTAPNDIYSEYASSIS